MKTRELSLILFSGIFSACGLQFEFHAESSSLGEESGKMIGRDEVRSQLQATFNAPTSTLIRAETFGGSCNPYKATLHADCDYNIASKKAVGVPSAIPARFGQSIKACYQSIAYDYQSPNTTPFSLNKILSNVPHRDQFLAARAIFNTRCANCHGGTFPSSPSDYWFKNISDSQFVQMGLVVPGSPATSPLYQRITSNQIGFRMPPIGALPAAEISVIAQWIQGMSSAPLDDELDVAVRMFYPTLETPSLLIDRLKLLRGQALTSSPNQPVKRAIWYKDDWKAVMGLLCGSGLWQAY